MDRKLTPEENEACNKLQEQIVNKYYFKSQEDCDKIYDKVVEELRGNLTAEEYKELIALEYVLTFSYTDDIDKDEERYKYLTNKKRNG